MGTERIGISNLFLPRQNSPVSQRRTISRSKRRSREPFDLSSITTPHDTRPFSRALKRLPQSLMQGFKKILRKKQDKFAPYRSLAPYYQEVFETEDATFTPKPGHTLAPPLTTDLSSSNAELFFERKDDVFKEITLHSGPRPLLCRGKLLHDRSGMVYLKVDPRFITLHAPLVAGCQTYSGFGEARIPIITAEESKRNHLWGNLNGLGKNFYFSIEGTYEVTHNSCPHYEKSYLFKVTSEPLNALRKEHTLSEALAPSGFVLIFGVKKRSNPVVLSDAGYFRVQPGIRSV